MFSFDMIEGYIGDDARVVTYDREELHTWEKEQFYKDGIEQGKDEERKVIIKNMLDNKMNISEISRILKTSEVEIEKHLIVKVDYNNKKLYI